MSHLADFCSSVDYGYTASAVDTPVGPRFLRITDIVNGRPQWGEVPFCHADASISERFRLFDGDVVIARTGATTGVSAFLSDPPDAVFASYLVRLKVDAAKADAKFISYYLKGPEYWDFVKGVLGDKSAQPNASAKTLTRAPATLPTLPEQQAIAAVLGALDDKIEQNRRTAKALERLARAIFRAWFVDFEPVKTKAAGATSFPSMPQAVFDALPSLFIDLEQGFLPVGWSLSPLSELCILVSGGTPKRSDPEYWTGDIPWYSVRDAPANTAWVLNTEEHISVVGIANSAARLLPEGGAIISARGTVGKLAMAGMPMAFNQSCYGVLPKNGNAFTYTYLLLQRAVTDLQQRTHGSVFETITLSTFEGLEMPSPPAELIVEFEKVVSPYFELSKALGHESVMLASIRNYLMPLLLSGQVSVSVQDE